MRAHVPTVDETGANLLQRFDAELGVRAWDAPDGRGYAPPKPRVTEDGRKIPDWWTDEEDASQAFLREQLVVLDGN